MAEVLPVGWVPRPVPLSADAVWIPDARLQAAAWSTDPRRSAWRGLAYGTGLLLLGPALPWTPEAVWLGLDPDAPALLLPTRLAPDRPVDLVADALLRAHPDAAPPLAVLPAEGLILPAGEATVLDPDRLRSRERAR